MARSTSRRLSTRAARAAPSISTRSPGSRATRTTSAIVSDRPSSVSCGEGIARSWRTGLPDTTPGPPARRLLPRHAAPHDELRVARIGLERPIHDEERLADVGDAERAVAYEAVAAVHLEHVAIPRDRQDPRRAVVAVLREVDARQVLDRVVLVVILDPRAGADRLQEEIVAAVPIDEEVDVVRRSIGHDAELAVLDDAVVVVVPKAKPAARHLGLDREQHDVAAVGPRGVRPERGPSAL